VAHTAANATNPLVGQRYCNVMAATT